MIITVHDTQDELFYLGRILIRELPAHWDREMFEFWYPRMKERERARYTVGEIKNLITTAGRTQVLTFIGNPSSNTAAFSQYFAVGTFPINSVQPGDTAVNGELFRAIPSSFTVSGNTVDVSTFFSTAQGNGTLTNCGLFGVNATGAGGSGTLMTHALLNNYVKDNAHTVTFDYLITLN